MLQQDPEQPVNRDKHINAVARNRARSAWLGRAVERSIEAFWAVLPPSVFLRFSYGQLAWATAEVLAPRPGAHRWLRMRDRDDREVTEMLVCAGGLHRPVRNASPR